jgi:Reverse transcriptase (RNA-dependent DNA polymerase)
MMSHGYQRTKADPCVCFKRLANGKFLFLLLYVDDILIAGHDTQMIDMLKKEMSKLFDMKDMGQARQILGMQIIHDRKTRRLWLSQEKYIERVLERFNMQEAKKVSCPLPNHPKLSKKLCPSTEKEKDECQEYHTL